MLTKACSQRLVVHLLFIWRSNNKTHLWHCASASSWAVNAVSIFLRTQTEPLLKPKHPEKTKARIAIYSAGEIWGFEAARAVLIHIIAERWRHAPTKVTPQVLKSSIAVFFPSPSCLSFISSPPVLVCIHLPCLFICTVSLLITSSFHLLSNDLWDQFDPQTNSLLLPSRRPVSLALFLIVVFFLFFFFCSLSFLCSSGGLFLLPSFLFCYCSLVFSSSSDLSIHSHSRLLPVNPTFPFSFLSHGFLSLALTLLLRPFLWLFCFSVSRSSSSEFPPYFLH